VIPHVINSNTISMYVNPIIEEVTGEVTVEGNSAPITLGNIPLLGHLFRNKSVSRQQTDLLIFITPKIVVQ